MVGRYFSIALLAVVLLNSPPALAEGKMEGLLNALKKVFSNGDSEQAAKDIYILSIDIEIDKKRPHHYFVGGKYENTGAAIQRLAFHVYSSSTQGDNPLCVLDLYDQPANEITSFSGACLFPHSVSTVSVIPVKLQ